MASNSSDKIHKVWEQRYSEVLYVRKLRILCLIDRGRHRYVTAPGSTVIFLAIPRMNTECSDNRRRRSDGRATLDRLGKGRRRDERGGGIC